MTDDGQYSESYIDEHGLCVFPGKRIEVPQGVDS